jgi:hypothetical protein
LEAKIASDIPGNNRGTRIDIQITVDRALKRHVFAPDIGVSPYVSAGADINILPERQKIPTDIGIARYLLPENAKTAGSGAEILGISCESREIADNRIRLHNLVTEREKIAVNPAVEFNLETRKKNVVVVDSIDLRGRMLEIDEFGGHSRLGKQAK